MSALSKASTGYTAVKFDKVGAGVAGVVVGFEDFQQTEFADDPKKDVKKGDLMFYPNSGDPIMGVKVNLETIPGDASSRVTLYCQGKLLMRAVLNAIKAAGGADLEVGADLAVVHDGYDGRAKTYSAEYSRPAPASISGDEEPAGGQFSDEPPF